MLLNKCQRECYNTGKVLIGVAYIPRHRYLQSADQVLTQAALLDKRTARPVSVLRRMAGVVWRWL